MALPVLYSFRRCPYAMRARLAVYYSGNAVELREVVLKDKPPQMLAASAKGTVPVLVLDSASDLTDSPERINSPERDKSPALVEDSELGMSLVIDESLEIMQWALEENDPNCWLDGVNGSLLTYDLVQTLDHDFKPLLDQYKYFDRYPEFSQDEYFHRALPFLNELDGLISSKGGSYLAGQQFSALDAAVFPFIRQFANSDSARFAGLELAQLQAWLDLCVSGDLFANVMKKYPAWSVHENNSVLFSKLG